MGPPPSPTGEVTGGIEEGDKGATTRGPGGGGCCGGRGSDSLGQGSSNLGS